MQCRLSAMTRSKPRLKFLKNRERTLKTFSKTLERKSKWETGLELDNTEELRLGFLSRGLTTTCLKSAGTLPSQKQVLIKTTRHSAKKHFQHSRRNNVQWTTGWLQVIHYVTERGERNQLKLLKHSRKLGQLNNPY